MPHINKTKPSRMRHGRKARKYRKAHDTAYRRQARENGTYGHSPESPT